MWAKNFSFLKRNVSHKGPDVTCLRAEGKRSKPAWADVSRGNLFVTLNKTKLFSVYLVCLDPNTFHVWLESWDGVDILYFQTHYPPLNHYVHFGLKTIRLLTIKLKTALRDIKEKYIMSSSCLLINKYGARLCLSMKKSWVIGVSWCTQRNSYRASLRAYGYIAF